MTNAERHTILLYSHLHGGVNVELEADIDVVGAGAGVLDGDIVLKGVLTHRHVATVLELLVGLRDALEDHAVERHLLGALLRHELARQRGTVEKVHGRLVGDHLLAVSALPGHTCSRLGVHQGPGAVLVLQHVRLQVSTGLLEGAVELRLHVDAGRGAHAHGKAGPGHGELARGKLEAGHGWCEKEMTKGTRKK